jgi:hypothetical protein
MHVGRCTKGWDGAAQHGLALAGSELRIERAAWRHVCR